VIPRFVATAFGLVALTGCAASAPTPAAPATGSMHAHPSVRAMTHAFERVHDDAQRCLRPGDRVSVRGAFRGAEGTFTAERVDGTTGALPYAVETCVRVAAEHAHVRPFSDEQMAFTYALEAPAESTAGAPLPMFASDGGVYAESAAGGFVQQGATGTMTIGSRPSPVDLIRREADALQRCYEQACERDHTISGHVELHLALDAGGRITRLTSRVDTPNEDVTLMELVSHCIESHVRLIQFGPQSYPGQEITVPLRCESGGIPIG